MSVQILEPVSGDATTTSEGVERPTDRVVMNQWYWQDSGGNWAEERSKSMAVRLDGKQHVYWRFLPASEVEGVISRLRFDPVNRAMPAEVQWVAVDLVK